MISEVRNSRHSFTVKDSSLDLVVPIQYRREMTIKFEYHQTGDDSCACCEFPLLPERDGRLELHAPDSASLVFSVIDFARTEVEDRGPIPRPSPDKVRPKKPELEEIQPFEEEKILALEAPETEFHRWIFSCTRDCGWPNALDILSLVHDHHEDVLARKQLADEFRLSIREVPDLITGFHFISPMEQIIVLETRAKAPNEGTSAVERYLRTLPKVVHALGDKRERFGAPRLYCLFNHLLKTIAVPMGIADLLRINGLYLRHSSLYQLCGVVNKLNALMGATSLPQAVEELILPTHRELKSLIGSIAAMYSAPLLPGMSTCVYRMPQLNLGEDGHSSHDRSYVPVTQAVMCDYSTVPPESPLSHSPRRLTTYSFHGSQLDLLTQGVEWSPDRRPRGMHQAKGHGSMCKTPKFGTIASRSNGCTIASAKSTDSLGDPPLL
jgi:hypothetical protein